MADPYQYYRNLIDAATATEDEEERGLIVANGVKELVERDEVEATSRDIAGSRMVQKLIELAPADGHALSLLAEPFAKDWFALATDRFSSYVLEDYLKRLAALPTSKITSIKAFGKFFRVICRVIRRNIDECLPHARASHVIRAMICALAAIRCFPKGVGDDAIRLLSPGISLKYRKRLITLACCMASKKVISRTALFTRLCNEYAAPVYCTLLKVSKYRFPEEFRLDFCKTLAKCIHSERKDPDGVCNDEILSHVLHDLILAVPTSSDLFDKLMSRYLGVDQDDEEERIAAMAVHPLGNYCVQTALRALSRTEDFSTFSEPILSSMTAIFNSGCLGVITQLVRAAVRLLSPASGIPPFANQLHSELVRVLSCQGAEKAPMLVPCLFYYLPFDNVPKTFDNGVERPPVNLPGCLLLEALFSLPNPSIYVDSLAAPTGFLVAAASTAEGYHVISQVLAAKNVLPDSKKELVACLAPAATAGQPTQVLPAALTHFGCLTYKAIWDSLPNQRKTIANYLSQFPDALRESKYGRFLWAAFSLRLFSLNPGRWADIKAAESAGSGVSVKDATERQPPSGRGGFEGRPNYNNNNYNRNNNNYNNNNNNRFPRKNYREDRNAAPNADRNRQKMNQNHQNKKIRTENSADQ